MKELNKDQVPKNPKRNDVIKTRQERFKRKVAIEGVMTEFADKIWLQLENDPERPQDKSQEQ